MRNLVLYCIVFVAAGCGEGESGTSEPNSPSAQTKPLIRFQDQNFGATFSHSEAMSTTYNPHGGANRVLINFDGKPIGGLIIASRPPTDSVEVFLDAGKEYYRQKYSASVTYEYVTNPKGYGFHHIQAKSAPGRPAYVIERYVHLRDIKNASPETQPEKAIMDELSGSFSFEFVITEEAKELLTSEIKTMIDTFEITSQP